MKLTVSYQHRTRYDIVSGRHRIVTDQSVEDGGQDEGLSPVELFVGSLASCIGYFVGQFCARHDIPREGLSVNAEWTMAENPHRVGHIDLAIHLPQNLRPELTERLLKVAHGCTVHQSLMVTPTVGIKLAPFNES
jgi:putative redox protein